MKKGDKVWTKTKIWVDGKARSGLPGVIRRVDGSYIYVRLCGMKHREAEFYYHELERRCE